MELDNSDLVTFILIRSLVMIQGYRIKIKRLSNKQLDNFVKNQGNCPCFTEEDSFWPHVKYDPLCIGLHRGVKLGMCVHTLSFVILFQHLVQSYYR